MSFTWDVIPPAPGRARRRARLSLVTTERGEEALELPPAVGRRLAHARNEGWEPSCRAELLRRVGELEAECAHARMEELVGRRDLSELELTQRLLRDGYDASVSGRVARRAREAGVVDDARYGAALARSKVLAGWGRIRIEHELERRGIDPASVEGWPEEFLSAEDERARALELARRRRLTGKGDFARVARFLCGRGFAPSVAYDVAHEVTDRLD